METRRNIKYLFGNFILDSATRTLERENGEIIALSSRAFDTLLALVERQGRTIPKDELLKIVWPNSVVEENNLIQAISYLRKALGDSKDHIRFIKTISGRGYCFISPLSIESGDAPSESEIIEKTPPAPVNAVVEKDPGTGEKITARTPDENAGKRAWQWIAVASVMLVSGILLTLWLREPSNTGRLPSESESQAFGTIAASTIQEPPPSLIPNSVAVLPFSILNPEVAENTLFATGLHDELINKLTKINSLNVISRESIIALRNVNQTKEIATQFGVESVITGNIQYAGTKARISLQMADSLNGVTIWAESYETDMLNLQDMISLQSDIANNVASALEAEVEEDERFSIASLPTESFEAYRYVLAGRQAYYDQDFGTAWELARMALERDPDYKDAMYLYSSINILLAGRPLPDYTSSDHYQLARQFAEKLISETTQKGEGYVLKAAAMSSAGDWLGVHHELQNIESIGETPDKLHILGSFFMSTGNFSKAIEVYHAHLITEPVNLYSRGFLLAALELAGRRDEARTEYAVGKELRPQWWGDTVNTLLALGRDEPVTDSDYLDRLPDQLTALLENPNAKEQIISKAHNYLDQQNTRSTEAILLAALAANIGEHDLAVELMHFAVKDVWLSFFFMWLPVFDETRKTDAFESLLLESGLVEYWNTTSWPVMCAPTAEGVTCDWQAYPDKRVPSSQQIGMSNFREVTE